MASETDLRTKQQQAAWRPVIAAFHLVWGCILFVSPATLLILLPGFLFTVTLKRQDAFNCKLTGVTHHYAELVQQQVVTTKMLMQPY